MFTTRQLFWTDWGVSAKIEVASMDGNQRQVLISNNLGWPNGITADYDLQRLYWVDAQFDKIEYAFYDGSGRTELISRLVDHPFALTLHENTVYWTDWTSNSLLATNKNVSINIRIVKGFIRGRPFGIEAISLNRQANGMQIVVRKVYFYNIRKTTCAVLWIRMSLCIACSNALRIAPTGQCT